MDSLNFLRENGYKTALLTNVGYPINEKNGAGIYISPMK